MLILTRRSGESVVIGNEIVVKVVEVRGDQVRIGIEAPREVQVHREEIFRQIEAENTQAASSASAARRLVARMPSAAQGGRFDPASRAAEPSPTDRDGPASGA